MAPKKLTEADKKSILNLYREPEETTSTLADRFGVSNSTISRLLKASLPAKEYGRLIQQKRSTADRPSPTTKTKDTKSQSKPEKRPEAAFNPEEESDSAGSPGESEAAPPVKPAPVLKKRDAASEDSGASVPEPEKVTPASVKRTRRRSKASAPETEAAQLSLPTEEEEAPASSQPAAKEPPKLKSRSPKEPDEEDPEEIPEDWGVVSGLDDDYGEDDDDDDDFEEDGEGWDNDDEAAPHVDKIEISPLTDASLPRLCYVVVERSSSELVALPLRTFAHLGEIPETEGESRTLPVFDNHRVARRFSRRNQRVVKLPDGALLQTTSPYLMAKGITRLLIDGQVFALEDDEDGYEEDDADFESLE